MPSLHHIGKRTDFKVEERELHPHALILAMMITPTSTALTIINQENDEELPYDIVPVDSDIVVPPDIQDQLHRIAEIFWTKTEMLAEQSLLLQHNQQLQASSQNQALVALHANAESNVGRLIEMQKESNAHLLNYVNETKASMHHQLQAVVENQAQNGAQLQKSLEEQIQRVLIEAVAARELVMQQANETRRLEATMRNAVAELRSEFNGRVDSLQYPTTVEQVPPPSASELHDQWRQLQHEMKATIDSIAQESVGKHIAESEKHFHPRDLATSRIKHFTEKAATEAETRVENRMRAALQAHRESIDAELARTSAAQTELIKQSITEATTTTERHIEEKMRKALEEAQAEMMRQVQYQSDRVSTVEKTMDARFDRLSSRIASLEAKATTPVAAPNTPSATTTAPVATTTTAPPPATPTTSSPATPTTPPPETTSPIRPAPLRYKISRLTRSTDVDTSSESDSSGGESPPHRKRQSVPRPSSTADSGHLRELVNAIRDATVQIRTIAMRSGQGRRRDQRPNVPSSVGSSTIAAIVTKMQKEVQSRANAAASRYAKKEGRT